MDLITALASGAVFVLVAAALFVALFRGVPTNTFSGWFHGLFGDPTKLPWPSGVQEDFDAPAWDVDRPASEERSQSQAEAQGPNGSIEDLAGRPGLEPATQPMETPDEPPAGAGNEPEHNGLVSLHPVVREWNETSSERVVPGSGIRRSSTRPA